VNTGTFCEYFSINIFMATESNALTVRSIAFSHNGHIPSKYTCEGENINPPLEISNIHEDAKTLAIIMEDPDAPKGVFDHWLVWNISPNEAISEKMNPGISGTNSFGKTGYGGPCPPSGSHRYYFKVYALDTELELPASADKKALKEAMKGHIVAEGELMAHYQKKEHLISH
jgi:Raf kinase inhibitor-like YbhB/YbcL family protein